MGRLGDHHIQRGNVATKATKAYKEAIDTYLKENLKSMAYSIVRSAYHLRMNNRGAHNFTGNLINSICAGVYFKGKLDSAFCSFELDAIKTCPPISIEMTANGARAYHFPKDWDGGIDTNFVPTVFTDQSYGNIHAVDFIESYTPTSQYLEIVLAYTVEYADAVNELGHLGYDAAFRDFNQMWLVFQEKVKKGLPFSDKHGHRLQYVNVTAK